VEVVKDIREKIGKEYVVEGPYQAFAAQAGHVGALVPPKIAQGSVVVVPLFRTDTNDILSADWKSAEPAGKPCQDTFGLRGDVARRLSREGCTIAIRYAYGDEVTLTNWRVTGDLVVTQQDQIAGFRARDLMSLLESKYPAYFRQQ
jgi:hypothetical protein